MKKIFNRIWRIQHQLPAHSKKKTTDQTQKLLKIILLLQGRPKARKEKVVMFVAGRWHERLEAKCGKHLRNISNISYTLPNISPLKIVNKLWPRQAKYRKYNGKKKNATRKHKKK